MIGALWILVVIIVVGIFLWVYDVVYWQPHHKSEAVDSPAEHPESPEFTEAEPKPEGESPEGGICCGMHAVCEKTSLTPTGTEADYYDDEELDRFRGRDASDYTPEESEEFREVMMTMQPEEVAGWSRSLQVRQIELPLDVREELLMIVGELRQSIKST